MGTETRLWGRKRLLPVTYSLTNLVYPYTLGVTDIMPTNRKDKIIQGRTL